MAKRFSWGVIVQFGAVDAIFVLYGFYNHWNIPSTTMTVWLSTTVVQGVGIVLVIARSLFPPEVKHWLTDENQ